MVGGRETLAKAVVYEAVRVAFSQRRSCLVFAFSGAHDLAQLVLVPPSRRSSRTGHSGRGGAAVLDRSTLHRLLAFLACSFGGGTDVAGPMRRALDLLEPASPQSGSPQSGSSQSGSSQSDSRRHTSFAGADILLVSDGELPNPPVDEVTFQRLSRLRATANCEVHGLLIGQERSAPLESLCDETHTFLSHWDPIAILQRKNEVRRA